MIQHIYNQHTNIIYICSCNTKFASLMEAVEHAEFEVCWVDQCDMCGHIACICDDLYVERLIQSQ